MTQPIRIQHLTNMTRVLVDGPIAEWWVSAEYIRSKLAEVQPGEPIELRINSDGGNPQTALRIYTMLRAHDGPVTAYIEFMCASACTLITAAADEVVMSNIGWYMIHRIGSEPGPLKDADQTDQLSRIMRAVEDSAVAIYAEKTGIGEDELRDMMSKETWLTAEEALELGFIDRIDEVVPVLDNSITDFKLTAKFNKTPKKLKNYIKKLRNGASLAARLEELIEEQINDDTERDDVLDAMASAAGIERGTVNQILNGSIDCPPVERLEGFAEALGTSLESLTEAGNQDGCSYDTESTTNKTDIDMSFTNKLKNYLGLSNDADDADVAISAKELKAKADKVDDLQAKIDKANETIGELEDELSQYKQDSEEQMDQLLENAVKQYKIKASAKEQLKEQFSEDPDGLKAMLDNIPGSKPGSDLSNNGAKNSRKTHMGGSLNSQVAKDFNVN